MAFEFGMTVYLCMAYNAHARVDDLALDERSQWAWKGKTSALNLSRQPISIKLAITAVTLFPSVLFT